MGAEASVIQKDFDRIAGEEAVDFDDEIWGRICDGEIEMPRKNVKDWLERTAASWTMRQFSENRNSGNYWQLLRHLIHMLALCTSGNHKMVSEKDVQRALNLVVMVRYTIKTHVQELTPESLLELYGSHVPAWHKETSRTESLLQAFCDAVALLLMSQVREAHTYYTYSLHFECAGLLLEMSATQMTQALGAPCNPFLDHLMSRREYARPFMFAMFKTWIEQQAAPVAPAIKPYNLFGSVSLSSTSKHPPWQIPLLLADSRQPPLSQLSEKCSLLILIFVNFSHPTLENPFRAELQQMHDSDPELVEEGRGESSHVMLLSHDDQCVHVPFSKLHDAFAKTLVDDRTVLLFYYTIYHNHRFLNYVLAKSEPQRVTRIEKRLDTDGCDRLSLYPCSNLRTRQETKPPNCNYMLLVIFLILSNDAIYSSNIHSPDCMMV
ncbi:hypothetical protein GUITHDRAFT_161749 [Guillardia theta CCMP2712]|uniref:Dymeclin n=1 Tax=Guillardia theta (strain CCMP2712) TaxID=905079 RepID=L1JRL0_GUITC|nr:hypothetical protein GUITHDRAFT_161749 [Guillardia theta CCMP2712]EKX50929.1 hypothetical protein GUITHDRAFT_161749 [Guillardia theta CCMP2712]|eukprot:XP_005837909.1 hypothetical protein GUITHDRAFT_161749 [Guillardia theta CCMP2712]